MSENLVAAALSTSISILGLIVLAYLLRGYLIDDFRDQLFALRDEMFLYACDEGLLDSPAHLNLRLLMNGMIRYAHRTSIGRLMILDLARRLLRIKLVLPPAFEEWARAVSELPEAQAQQFVKFHSMALILAMKHMMKLSPLLWIGTLALGVYFLVWQSTRMLVDRSANTLRNHMLPIDLFESEAFKAVR